MIIKKVALLVFILINLLLHTSYNLTNYNPSIDIHISRGNLYEQTFTEPFETVLVFFPNGDIITMTGHYEFIVPIPAHWFISILEDCNKNIKDALIVIHNHSKPARFSPGDINFYRKIKRGGFNGLFMIYYSFNKKSIIYNAK